MDRKRIVAIVAGVLLAIILSGFYVGTQTFLNYGSLPTIKKLIAYLTKFEQKFPDSAVPSSKLR